MNTSEMSAWAKTAKQASKGVAFLNTDQKNAILLRQAELLLEHQSELLSANAKDLEYAKRKQVSNAMLDRLLLNSERIAEMVHSLHQVAALKDPVGQRTSEKTRPNGIRVLQQTIPLGLILMIYEARPNVAVEAAALCLKSGNGCILRGGSEAFHSSQVIGKCWKKALVEHDVEGAAVSVMPSTDRELLVPLLRLNKVIDLVIPRGGESLIRFVSNNSRIPVIQHYKGVCHLYIDKDADLNIALELFLNGKTQRTGVCNALEGLVVHQAIAKEFFQLASSAIEKLNVEVRGCPLTCNYLAKATPVSESDYGTEYLDLIVSSRVVANFAEAIDHIEQFGSFHTEVICSKNHDRIEEFIHKVDASVVMANASSRFSDGGQLGLGAEIGISTTKLHAYGPMGLESLTTKKYVVLGDGQIRQ